MNDTSEIEHKRAFALALATTPKDPYKAALVVFPHDIAKAIAVSQTWSIDPDVIEAIAAIPDEVREGLGVPTKNDVIRLVYERLGKVLDSETFFKGAVALHKWMEGDGGVNVNIDNRSVMIVTDHGTDAEWEAKLIAQQTKLVEHAAQTI